MEILEGGQDLSHLSCGQLFREELHRNYALKELTTLGEFQEQHVLGGIGNVTVQPHDVGMVQRLPNG